jgi:hypothetical protein
MATFDQPDKLIKAVVPVVTDSKFSEYKGLNLGPSSFTSSMVLATN